VKAARVITARIARMRSGCCLTLSAARGMVAQSGPVIGAQAGERRPRVPPEAENRLITLMLIINLIKTNKISPNIIPIVDTALPGDAGRHQHN